MYEGLFLEYAPYVKDDKTFNKEGGLFTRFANVSVRRRIKGETEEHHRFRIYDCIMTTSSGKNQQTHFDGIYYILEKRQNTQIQVRSNGSPKEKGVKFDRLKEFEEMKVYKKEGESMLNIDHQFINLYNKLAAYNEHKRVYIGVNQDEVHVALWHRKHPAKKMTPFTLEKLNSTTTYFLSEYQLINEIANIDAF
jgi:hypothetical protein